MGLSDAIKLAKDHESEITALLLIVAAILIGIAIFGRIHHKALALVFIVL